MGGLLVRWLVPRRIAMRPVAEHPLLVNAVQHAPARRYGKAGTIDV